LLASAAGAMAAPGQCAVQSGALRTPVLELYTSEGCSSCPPADKWLSSLKGHEAGAVVQAFHVGYWDYIGWVDRFATPAFTARQKDIAAHGSFLSGIYTPQTVLDGRDWRGWGRSAPTPAEPARASIALKQIGQDQFEAQISTKDNMPVTWSAYWTVTEDGHSSRVKAGENNGEYLQHDYVVRQYVPAGEYKTDAATPQRLTLRSIPASDGHARRVNLVVFDTKTLKPLQAVSVGC
jgi:hypothetical protein